MSDDDGENTESDETHEKWMARENIPGLSLPTFWEIVTERDCRLIATQLSEHNAQAIADMHNDRSGNETDILTELKKAHDNGRKRNVR